MTLGRSSSSLDVGTIKRKQPKNRAVFLRLIQPDAISQDSGMARLSKLIKGISENIFQTALTVGIV